MFEYKYPHPAVAADIAAFALDDSQLKILLVQRGEEPHLGRWALPGGFLRPDEEIEDCAKRELLEETSVGSVSLIQFGIYSKPDRDSRERVVSVAYVTAVHLAKVVLKAGTDAAEAEWFPVDQLPAPLAFDHGDLLADAMKALERNVAVLSHAPVEGVPALAPLLLGDAFSLSELQAAVETITGKACDKRNFRKQVLAHWLEPAGTVSRGRHRPALNYTLRPEELNATDK